MTAQAIRDTANQCILPVLLGNTGRAHRIAARVFRHFGVLSLICGTPRLLDLADFSSVTLRMPKTEHERLTVDTLIDFAEQYPEPLLLLVPCSASAAAVVAHHKEVLESYFMLSDGESIFTSSPLTDFEKNAKP